jgi:glyoxylase-like metal-dependent hydrolase (beta-lactamase superfamily II)
MPTIQVRAVVSPVFGAVSYVVSTGRDAVVVDAGAGVLRPVRAVVASAGLRVHAVLLTHGHLDHTWDACGLADGFDVPCLVHEEDAEQLRDPFSALGDASTGPAGRAVSSALEAELRASGRGRDAYRSPDRVERLVTPGGIVALEFGELSLDVLHAPGHTPGSMLVHVVGEVEGDVVVGTPAPVSGVLLTGDVLFAGTVGRTDLPGGDTETMGVTLRDVVAGLEPRLLVLPGHGPATTLARELVTNPFLAS